VGGKGEGKQAWYTLGSTGEGASALGGNWKLRCRDGGSSEGGQELLSLELLRAEEARVVVSGSSCIFLQTRNLVVREQLRLFWDFASPKGAREGVWVGGG
jgi:hypothetical protein